MEYLMEELKATLPDSHQVLQYTQMIHRGADICNAHAPLRDKKYKVFVQQSNPPKKT
jgi:hypothetical protein